MSDPDDHELNVPQDNLFRLFETDPNWREAERQLKAACVEAAEKITAIRDKYEGCSAGDTDVQDAITDFMWLLLWGTADKAAEVVLEQRKMEREAQTDEILEVSHDIGTMLHRRRRNIHCDVAIAALYIQMMDIAAYGWGLDETAASARLALLFSVKSRI